MKIKLLSGVIAMCIACPAMADNLMNNQTLPGMCNVSTLGVSSGTKSATANFEPNWYSCGEGEYLPANATECATCPAGYYCGSPGSYEYSDEDQGLESCDDFASSMVGNNYGAIHFTTDPGADMEGQCYTMVDCPTISDASVCDSHAATCAYTNNAVTSAKSYLNSSSSTLNCAVSFTCATGYTLATITLPTLPTGDATEVQNRSHKYPNGLENNPDNDLAAGEWKATWASGTMRGIGVVDSDDPNGTSMNCWCKATSWTPTGGETQLLSSTSIGFYYMLNSADCGGENAMGCCTDYCSYMVGYGSDVRSAIFALISTEQCVPNTITLNWGDGNGGIHATNSCSYDGAITTPATAPTKRGHRFTGWSFE